MTCLSAWSTIERTQRLIVVLVSTLLLGFAPAREAISATPGPITLAEIDTGAQASGFVFARDKLAWTTTKTAPSGTPGWCRNIRVLDLRTHRRDRLGACDDIGRTTLIGVADDGTAYSETYLGSNTESDWRFYENSARGARLIVAYVAHDCSTSPSPSCDVQLFVAGREAFVIHGGAVFRVAGPKRLEQILDVGGSFLGASWPLVALSARQGTRVYRLTDGKLIRTVAGYAATAAVSSELLVQVGVGTHTDISRVYDLASGRRLAVIRDESVLAVSGRRVVTSVKRLLFLRVNGLNPRTLASSRGRVVWATLEGNRLLWVEQVSAFPFHYRLRALEMR